MQSIWLSLVPYNIAADILAHPHEPVIGREQRFEAVALFADITGFTAMSEALGRAGKTGTEELTALLNSYFRPTIELIHSYGGIVGKFGGDSLTVLFPYKQSDVSPPGDRALQCALEMQRNLAGYQELPTSAGSFSLGLRIGLASGPVLCTTVGDPSIRLEYIIAGRVLERCAGAEQHARPGEVVVDPSLRSTFLPDQRRKLMRVSGINTNVSGAPLAPLPEIPESALPVFTAYLHPAIVQLLRSGQAGFIDEHRKVTVVFVSFSGFDYDNDPQVSAGLQRYFIEVIRVVDSYNGYLKHIDMSDKGSTYMLLFGAPIAHEDDEERALRCALDLRHLSSLAGIPTRIGISTGYVYCGLTGAPARQEYTAIGDAVNLAARLMEAAKPAQILVSNPQRQVINLFEWESLTTLQIKGRSDPIPTYSLSESRRRVLHRAHEPAPTLPMVGRTQEMLRVNTLISEVLQGKSRILGITAEAGMGKSRLITEILRLARQRGMEIHSGECLSYGITTSYLVWQSILQGIFGIDPNWNTITQARYLQHYLEYLNPEYAERLPLLGAVLSLPITETEFTRALDPQTRKSLLESLVIESVLQRASEVPLLLVLENCHWIDALSHELLVALCKSIGDLPILIVAAYRLPETEPIQLNITRLKHFSEIVLSELTQAEAEQLTALKLVHLFDEDRATPELVARIVERSQGNPFYIEEMINLLHDRQLDPTDPQVVEALDLPDSLNSLIISRIDQLNEGPKNTIKISSVIGRLFNAAWIWGIYPEIGSPKEVREHLSTLSLLDLITVVRSEPELECFFKQALTRDVAYASLSVATRTMLHEQVGRFIEKVYADRLDRYIDLLAYHYGMSNKVEKQREYFRKAGEAAQAAYANDAAIDYYQRLLPLLPPREQIDILYRIGEIWQLTGKWTEAESAYRQALDLAQAEGDDLAQARCRTALGALFYIRGQLDEALELLEQAQREYERLGLSDPVDTPLGYIGNLYLQRGDYQRALAYLERWLNLATQAGDRRGISKATANIGHVHFYQGNYRRALECFEQWLQLVSELGDRRQIAAVVGNVGIAYWYLGDLQQAVKCFERQMLTAAAIGDQRLLSIACGNMAEVYQQQGDKRRALACYARQLQIAMEMGNRQQATIAMGYIATLALAQERYTEAEHFCKQAIALGRPLALPYYLCEFLSIYADLCERQGRLTDAQMLNTEAREIAAAIGRKEILLRAQLQELGLSVALQQISPGEMQAKLEELLSVWPDEREQASIHYAIWRQDQTQEQHRRAAAALYERLYHQAPYAHYHRRYEELTGKRLPDPPVLSDPPAAIVGAAPDLDVLMQQIALLEDW